MTYQATTAVPALILAALLAGLPGAPAAAEPAGVTAVAAAPALEGSSWLLAAYRDGTAWIDSAESPRPPRFRFESGRVAGSAGCNLIGGAYTLTGASPTGTSLSFKANLTSTMMACPDPLMKQEQAVAAALPRVASYRLNGDLLELLDAAGEPQLRFRFQKPAPLVGQVWELTGYNNGKQAISSVRAGTEITLEFRDDGTLGGSDGCNRYMSGYTLKGDALTIGPLASTRMACKGAAEQARDYGAALATVTRYRIEGDELVLLNGDGKPAARYRVQVVEPPAPAPLPTGEAPESPADALPPAAPAPTDAPATPSRSVPGVTSGSAPAGAADAR